MTIHKVVYGIKVGDETEIHLSTADVSNTNLLYYALGIAAQLSFVRARSVLVTENGTPYRCVHVYQPRP